MRSKKIVVVGVVMFVVAAAVGTLLCYASGAPEDGTYVGPAKCRMCHRGQHKTWRKMKHAKAFEALVGDERKDPECVKCHTTAFGKPGGFVSEEKTPGMKNVGCEACHGPASAHVKVAAKNLSNKGEWDKQINRTPQNACINCHNPHVNQKERAEALRKAR